MQNQTICFARHHPSQKSSEKIQWFAKVTVHLRLPSLTGSIWLIRRWGPEKTMIQPHQPFEFDSQISMQKLFKFFWVHWLENRLELVKWSGLSTFIITEFKGLQVLLKETWLLSSRQPYRFISNTFLGTSVVSMLRTPVFLPVFYSLSLEPEIELCFWLISTPPRPKRTETFPKDR